MKKRRCLLAATLLITCSLSLVSYAGPNSRAAYVKRNWGETTAAESRETAGGSSGSPQAASKEDLRLFADAVSKMRKLTSVEVQTSLNLCIELDGQTTGMLLSSQIKGEDLGRSTMKYTMSNHMEATEETWDVNLFYTDGYLYTNTGGEKTKFPSNQANIMEVFDSTTNSDWLSRSDSFKDMKVSEDRRGNRIFTFVCDLENAGSSVNDLYTGLGLDAAADMKPLNGTVCVNAAGYITHQSLDMNVDIGSSGRTASVFMKMDIMYVNPGKAVKITLPSTAGYQETS